MGSARSALLVNQDVRRPNGKLYRPRKMASVVPFGDLFEDDTFGLIVLRTHDLTIAHMLGGSRWYGGLHGHDDPGPCPEPRIGWTRFVPWGPFGDDRGMWIEDPVRGVPSVTYSADL